MMETTHTSAEWQRKQCSRLQTHPCTLDDIRMFNDLEKNYMSNDGKNRFDDEMMILDVIIIILINYR